MSAPKIDPEIRFPRYIAWGEPPPHRPELGPCLVWTGGAGRYGRFTYGGKYGLAHRYAWERVNGEIPAHLTVDHLCRVTLCVNVDHMELVTAAENNRRAAAIRTHCKHGHPFIPENMYVLPSKPGARICKTCVKATSIRNAKRLRQVGRSA